MWVNRSAGNWGGGTPCLGGTMQFKPVSFKGQLNSWAQSSLRSSRTQRLRNATDLNTTRIRHFLWPTCFSELSLSGHELGPAPAATAYQFPEGGRRAPADRALVRSHDDAALPANGQRRSPPRPAARAPHPGTAGPRPSRLLSTPGARALVGAGDHFWVNTHIGKRSD